MERQAGYYRVKTVNGWDIIPYNGVSWSIPYQRQTVSDEHFLRIIEQPINPIPDKNTHKELIKVSWFLISTEEEANEILFPHFVEFTDIYPNKSLVICVSGVMDFGCDLISECGVDIIDKDGLSKVITHIKKLIEPPIVTSIAGVPDLWEVIRNNRRPSPTLGEFLIVVEHEVWQSNHPLDPEEWDSRTTFLGILGEDIKLIYQ